jgi:hypothetical protein
MNDNQMALFIHQLFVCYLEPTLNLTISEPPGGYPCSLTLLSKRILLSSIQLSVEHDLTSIFCWKVVNFRLLGAMIIRGKI